jgi:hypothetical protein
MMNADGMRLSELPGLSSAACSLRLRHWLDLAEASGFERCDPSLLHSLSASMAISTSWAA